MTDDSTTIGVDVGGTNLRVALVASDGRLDGRHGESITRNADAAVERIRDLCRDRATSCVKGIGIGLPGRVDARRRETLSGGYIDFAGTRLAERVEDATGLPVAIDNDCNMALVAEMALGAARGCRNVVMFTIGTGIGGALALDGLVVRGAATAGQLGHLSVAETGPVCKCGRRGCVETISSGSALGRHIREAGLPPKTRVEDLRAASAIGDARAAGVLRRWAVPLRAAIDSMVAALAPDVVLLGGGLGKAASEALECAPAISPWYQCRVEAALLGDDAGVIGAGFSARDAARALANGTAVTGT